MKPDVISNLNSIISSPLEANGGHILLGGGGGEQAYIGSIGLAGAVDSQLGWGNEE